MNLLKVSVSYCWHPPLWFISLPCFFHSSVLAPVLFLWVPDAHPWRRGVFFRLNCISCIELHISCVNSPFPVQGLERVRHPWLPGCVLMFKLIQNDLSLSRFVLLRPNRSPLIYQCIGLLLVMGQNSDSQMLESYSPGSQSSLFH